MKPRTIHEAVDALVNGKRVLLFKDERGYNVRGDVPSLIEQLEASVGRSGTLSGAGSFTSRPPLSMGVAALLIEITTKTAAAVMAKHGKPLDTITDNLRRIAADRADIPNDPDTDEWIDQCAKWEAKARSALGLEPKYPRGLRGVPCPNCGADYVAVEDDDQKVRVPALQFVWSQPAEVAEDELPPDRLVRAIQCAKCETAWFAGSQFYELKEYMKRLIDDNTTRETLAIVADAS